MITIDSDYIHNNGGLLNSISKKSSQYLRNLLRDKKKLLEIPPSKLKQLNRTVVHKNPHIDEYFADLLFRSALPENKQEIEFIEMSVHSRDNDSNCKALWPNAAVFGLGREVSGGASPLLIYDEHLLSGDKTAPSCSHLVASYVIKTPFPHSLNETLIEIDEIDSLGRAHDQNIGNIIKAVHNTFYDFNKGKNEMNSRLGKISDRWKKAIMDAAMVAIIYCIEEGINLDEDYEHKKNELTSSLNYFLDKSGFDKDSNFLSVINRMKNIFSNQKVELEKARLPKSKEKYQNFMLAKVCVAMNECWGQSISSIVMMHFWESIYLGQRSFICAQEEFKKFSNRVHNSIQTKYGKLERFSLEQVHILPEDTNKIKPPKDGRLHLWFLNIEPSLVMMRTNQVAINYLNKHNHGFGLIFINDTYSGTKVIFKGSTFPLGTWMSIVELFCLKEPLSWYKIENEEKGTYAGFLLNGNATHQYIPVSDLTFDHLIHAVQCLQQ